ncbi:hypothetical protein [Actinomyces capricornis]|uniref:hypothetical protein n=1 Tax=Actinomyces capricornis TaxID=2755559 RepID=UPI001CC64188|nr:hypothetical protein [Actinomyces capricornis]
MRECLAPAGARTAEPPGAPDASRGTAIRPVWPFLGVMAAIVMARRDTVDR